jgi:hypothetical protein
LRRDQLNQDVAASPDARTADLLTSSGGKPVIQIVLDPELETTTIRAVGVDHAEIPQFIVRLGKALTGAY